MPGNTVIKWGHRILTAVLLLLVLGYVGFQIFFNGPPDDGLVSSQKVNESTWLYVTKYNGGGATVSDVYRYYLDGRLAANPLKHLGESTPFLVSDAGNAKVTGDGNRINVTLTGRIYSFTNSIVFYSDGAAFMPVISIIANGVPQVAH
ncbi:hypothetical protein [Dryocola clanedunensis]